MRRRGRAEFGRLRALPPSAFEELSARDRPIVARYYGLDGNAPSTAAELAAALGVSTRPVRDSLARSLRSLIGSGSAPHDEVDRGAAGERTGFDARAARAGPAGARAAPAPAPGAAGDGG